MTNTSRSHHSDQPFSMFDRMPYVFGSSTPREFSYMFQVPAKFRVYDVKLRPSRSRATKDEMTLSDYIRRIRSSSPAKRRRDRSVDTAYGAGPYVFGSSTPRKWLFMDKIPAEYRVYDVRLNGFGTKKRSKTTSFGDYGVNKIEKNGTTAAKSSSLTGMLHHGDKSARQGDGHSAKSTARTRSVPPSASSSKQGNTASAANRRTESRGASSSKQNRPLDIRVARGHSATRTSTSSSTKSYDKTHSSLTTPNEELVLVVTETVANIIASPSSPTNNGGVSEEALTSQNDRPDNRAISSSIENRSIAPSDHTEAVVVGQPLLQTAGHLVQHPVGVVNALPSHNNNHDSSHATKLNNSNESESEFETSTPSINDHNKTATKASMLDEVDSVIVDNVMTPKGKVLLSGQTSSDGVRVDQHETVQ